MIGRKRALIIAQYGSVFVAFLALGLIASFFWERDDERVLRGVVSAGCLLSEQDEEEISVSLKEEATRLSHLKLSLKLRDSILESSAAELGLSLDVDRMQHEALLAGRGGGLLSEFGFWLARLRNAQELPLRVALDAKLLKERVEPWAQKLIVQPLAPQLIFTKSLQVEFGRGGESINFELLGEEMVSATLERRSAVLTLSPEEEKPLVEREEVEEILKRATRLLSSPLRLKYEGSEQEGKLQVSDLGRALSTEVTDAEASRFLLHLDAAILRRAARKFFNAIEHGYRDANFEFGPGDKVRILESEEGLVLDEEAFVSALLNLDEGKKRTLLVPFKAVAPKVSTQDAEELKVGGLITSFTTRHPCCRPRVKNIHHAAEQLDGTILRPGERFSLNGLLGPRTQASGYHQAPTIVHGEMKETWGGGISQLATTLFNAALRGGLSIVQRQPHSIYFSRYPEGHEATVSFPEPDLIFENDTKSALVIKTQYTGRFIKVLLYGDGEGRKVTTHRSKRFNVIQPPVEYEIDEEMDHERPRRLRAGQMGWTVSVSRKVEFKDGRIEEQERKVIYQPRAELMRVHPCIIPEDHADYSGEPCPEPEEEKRKRKSLKGKAKTRPKRARQSGEERRIVKRKAPLFQHVRRTCVKASFPAPEMESPGV